MQSILPFDELNSFEASLRERFMEKTFGGVICGM